LYSIYVYCKNDTEIEFGIGSASFLSFIYQPAKKLNLNVLYTLSEGNDLTTCTEFLGFIDDIKKVCLFWKDSNHNINGFRPDEYFINRLNLFFESINLISFNEIDTISIF